MSIICNHTWVGNIGWIGYLIRQAFQVSKKTLGKLGFSDKSIKSRLLLWTHPWEALKLVYPRKKRRPKSEKLCYSYYLFVLFSNRDEIHMCGYVRPLLKRWYKLIVSVTLLNFDGQDQPHNLSTVKSIQMTWELKVFFKSWGIYYLESSGIYVSCFRIKTDSKSLKTI